MIVTGSLLYPIYDNLGSTIGIVDPSGFEYDAFKYDSWGVLTAPSKFNTQVFPFLFAGREGCYWDEEGRSSSATTPLLPIYMRGRFYQPLWGRWLNPDPLGFDSGDFNLYRYVRNNPIILTDPSGLGYGEALWNILGWIPGISVIINALTPAPGSNVLDYSGCKPPTTCAGGKADAIAIQQCKDCVNKTAFQSVLSTTVGGVWSGSADALAAAILQDLAKTLAKKAVVIGIFGVAAVADLVITAVKVFQILDAASDAKNKFCK